MKKFYEILEPLGFKKIEKQRYVPGKYNPQTKSWSKGSFEKTGKIELNASMSYNSSRTLLRNPNAEVLAYINIGDEMVWGIIKTKRKIKGFKAVRCFWRIFEENPIEALKKIKEYNKKPECYIDRKTESLLVADAI